MKCQNIRAIEEDQSEAQVSRVGGTVREEQVWQGGALAEVNGTVQDNPIPRWCNKARMEENHPTRSVRGREEICYGH